MIREFSVKDEKQMRSLGSKIAQGSFPGAFIACFGDLGAGKTTLVRGLASELGIETIASPTFNIVRSHKGTRMNLDHFDAYRLADYEELLSIGFDEYIDSDSIVVMEWCENVIEALPQQRLEVHIFGSGDDERRVKIIAVGNEYENILMGLDV